MKYKKIKTCSSAIFSVGALAVFATAINWSVGQQNLTASLAQSTCGDGICSYDEWGVCETDNCLADRCTDSDPNTNRLIKGTVRANGRNKQSDYCEQETLYQYNCVEKSNKFMYEVKSFTCKNGCRLGVCIEDDKKIDFNKRLSLQKESQAGTTVLEDGTRVRQSKYNLLDNTEIKQSKHVKRHRKIYSKARNNGKTYSITELKEAIQKQISAEQQNLTECRNQLNQVWSACAAQLKAESLGKTKIAAQQKKIKCHQAKRNERYRTQYADYITDCDLEPKTVHASAPKKPMSGAQRRAARMSRRSRISNPRPTTLTPATKDSIKVKTANTEERSQRNAERRSEVNTILNAAYQYSLEFDKKLPFTIPADGNDYHICPTTTNCQNSVAFDQKFYDSILVTMVTDPLVANTSKDTGYTVSLDTNGRLTVRSLLAEAEDISVTR